MTASRAAAPPGIAAAMAGVPWPRAIETLVTEGLALDAASGRGELVDRERASEIVRELEAYVDALPEHEQSRVARALARRFISEAA